MSVFLTVAAVEIHAAWPWFWPLWGVVLGGVLGSFLSCALYRVPRGLSLRQPPSFCPACGTTLRVPDLIPVLSWLGLRGKCQYCHAQLPLQTLLLEVLCGLGAGVAVWLLLP